MGHNIELLIINLLYLGFGVLMIPDLKYLKINQVIDFQRTNSEGDIILLRIDIFKWEGG